MWKMEADLRLLQLESFELTGGASRVSIHRPVGVAMRAELTGGASQITIDVV
jgi:hypothetical protein